MYRDDEYYKKNRERILKYKREFYASNIEAMRERGRVATKKWRSKRAPSVRALLNSAKERAKHLNVLFDLEPGDLSMPNECPVFGCSMTKGTRYAPSLDRIDNNKGYVKGNVQIISRKANAMKSDATKEELKQFADWIYLSE